MLALALAVALAPAADPKSPDPRQVAEKYLAAVFADKVDAAVKLAEPEKSPADPDKIRRLKAGLDVKTLAIPTVIFSDDKGYALAVSEEVKLPQKKPTDPARGVLLVAVRKTKDGAWRVRDVDVLSAAEAAKRIEEAKKAFADAKELPPTKS